MTGIEDDPIESRAFARAFGNARANRLHLSIFDDMERAYTHVSENRVDWPFVVVLDLDLHGRDGTEFIRRVRNNETIHKIPIFVWTKTSNERELDTSFFHHVAGYFLKDARDGGVQRVVDALVQYLAIMEFPEDPGDLHTRG